MANEWALDGVHLSRKLVVLEKLLYESAFAFPSVLLEVLTEKLEGRFSQRDDRVPLLGFARCVHYVHFRCITRKCAACNCTRDFWFPILEDVGFRSPCLWDKMIMPNKVRDKSFAHGDAWQLLLRSLVGQVNPQCLK